MKRKLAIVMLLFITIGTVNAEANQKQTTEPYIIINCPQESIKQENNKQENNKQENNKQEIPIPVQEKETSLYNEIQNRNDKNNIIINCPQNTFTFRELQEIEDRLKSQNEYLKDIDLKSSIVSYADYKEKTEESLKEEKTLKIVDITVMIFMTGLIIAYLIHSIEEGFYNDMNIFLGLLITIIIILIGTLYHYLGQDITRCNKNIEQIEELKITRQYTINVLRNDKDLNLDSSKLCDFKNYIFKDALNK